MQHSMIVMDVVSEGWGKREKKFVLRTEKCSNKKKFKMKVAESLGRGSNDEDAGNRYRD